MFLFSNALFRQTTSRWAPDCGCVCFPSPPKTAAQGDHGCFRPRLHHGQRAGTCQSEHQLCSFPTVPSFAMSMSCPGMRHSVPCAELNEPSAASRQIRPKPKIFPNVISVPVAVDETTAALQMTYAECQPPNLTTMPQSFVSSQTPRCRIRSPRFSFGQPTGHLRKPSSTCNMCLLRCRSAA
ncbi:hypothetical protein BKA80DRAFT_285096 [Phyllosticta citrichinensis]